MEEDEFTIAGRKSALIDERVRNEALKRKYEELFFREQVKETGPVIIPESPQKENVNSNIFEKEVEDGGKNQRASVMPKVEKKSLKPESKVKPKTSLNPGKNRQKSAVPRSKSKKSKNGKKKA